MILLLNTTKTMNLNCSVSSDLDVTEPCFLDKTQLLAKKIAEMSIAQLTDLMSLSDKLAAETRETVLLWGEEGSPKVSALFGFTGLLFQNFDVVSLSKDQLDAAQKKVRILSGLYGLLRPMDMIEAYRCEMGLKLKTGKIKNLTEFWKETLTESLNKDLKENEPIISVASQEYMKALDIKKLNGPVISPVFKEQHPNGAYKNVVVHAKKARGALLRYALENNAEHPQDLAGFNTMGWRATQKAPETGSWLFTRPVSS